MSVLTANELSVTKLISSDHLLKVDPRVREMAEGMLAGPGFNEMGALDLRQMTRDFLFRETPLPVEGLAEVKDREIPGPAGPLRIRVYTPLGQGPFPAMMYFHGGGFVAGDLDTQDNVCRMCCGVSGFVVVSVEYRLAPEHKFPAAPEDCYTATRWVAEQAASLNARSSHLVVFGESSGGNLAAAVCLMARDRRGPNIRHQIIVYGALQQLPQCDLGYLAQSGDKDHPYASPLLAPDLTGLPSATVITAECDTMTPFGIAYAHRLIEAGIETHYYSYAGMIHGFLGDERLEACHQAIQDLSARARNAVGGSQK